MTFSYSDTLATDLSWIRFKIGDTISGSGPRPNSSARNYTDELVAAVLAEEGHRVATVAALFEALAAEWGRYKTIEKDSDVQSDSKEVAGYYAALADEWRSKPDGGGGGRNTIAAGVIGLDIASKNDDWQ